MALPLATLGVVFGSLGHHLTARTFGTRACMSTAISAVTKAANSRSPTSCAGLHRCHSAPPYHFAWIVASMCTNQRRVLRGIQMTSVVQSEERSDTLARDGIAEALLRRVKANDCAGEAAAAALPFLIGEEILGCIMPSTSKMLAEFPEVFEVSETAVRLRDDIPASTVSSIGVSGGGDAVLATNGTTRTPLEARSATVQSVLRQLRAADAVPMLRGWRDETFAVRASFHAPPRLLIERAAAPLFGAGAYGVFLNGYVCADETEPARPTHLWLGKRAENKPTWPGLLDCVVAGGLAAGELPRTALLKECAEEAGMSRELSVQARASSVVSYTSFNEDKWGLKRDNLFTFDLRLPADFVPVCADGEMAAFTLTPMREVLSLVASAEPVFKPNVGVVVIDFLVRHGFVEPDEPGYLQLLGALRGADCR